MKNILRMHRTVTILSLIVCFEWISSGCKSSIAQDIVRPKGDVSKEELKLDIKSSLNKQTANSNSKQEISVPEAAQMPKGQRLAKGAEKLASESGIKFFLNVKNGLRKGAIPGKKLFRRETGLVDIGSQEGGTLGTLGIEDCIAVAVENHLPLQIAKKNIKLAEMRIFEAQRNMLPSVTLGYEETIGKIFGRYYFGRKQFVEGQQPVFHGGELYFTMRQSMTNLEVVKNDYDKTKNELVLQVKKGYYTLGKAKDNLKMQCQLSQEVGKVYDRVIKQADAGITTKLEFLNVSSQASQIKYQLLSAEGDVGVAELILKQAMNVDPGLGLDVNPIPGFKKVDIDFGTVLRTALVNRPEIKINLLMMDYYNYGKSIAKAKGWPKVDILGSWGLAKEEFLPRDRTTTPGSEDVDRKIEQQWYAGIKASMPFWGSTAEYSWTREQWTPVVSAYQGTESATNSYKLKILDKLDYYSDRQLADIDFDRARQELIKTKQDVTLEAKESSFNYKKSLIQLETAVNKLKYQEKELEATKAKRELDEMQDSNLIDSMIKLAQEKFGYLQALTDCHTTLAALNKAIGIEDYFKDEPPTPGSAQGFPPLKTEEK